MAIVFLQIPNPIVAAFNEIPLVVQTPKGRYDQLTKDLANATTTWERNEIQKKMAELESVKNQDTLDPITVSVSVGNDTTPMPPIVLNSEAGPDGKATIDLSFIMRRTFFNTDSEENNFEINMFAEATIISGDNRASFYALNAVTQPGYYSYSPFISEYAKLTNTPLTRFGNYPMTLTLMSSRNRILRHVWKANGAIQLQDTLHYPVGNVVVQNFQRIDTIEVYVDGTTQLLASYPVAEGCVPDAPFFVRWINASGGWDSWMFERREETDDVEDVSNIQLYIADPIDTQATVSLSATRTVTVGEGLLSKEDYRALAAMPRSPRIEWYNEEPQGWHRIVIADSFSSSWNSRNGFGSVEFTFAMPRILTQF